MSRPDLQPVPDDDAARWRRWYICPRVDCPYVEEHDARQVSTYRCPEHGHRLRVLFNNRLMP